MGEAGWPLRALLSAVGYASARRAAKVDPIVALRRVVHWSAGENLELAVPFLRKYNRFLKTDY